MVVKLILLIVFFAVMVSVGMYSRRHATSVDGFVLGGRSVGPWLTAFAYGTSYFSAVAFLWLVSPYSLNKLVFPEVATLSHIEFVLYFIQLFSLFPE